MRLATLSMLCVAPLAGAQGADDCASAQALTGLGQFPFDNTNATADGSTTTCAMDRDVWFRWTAPQSRNVTISTCGGTSVDTGLAVYAGTACPTGLPLACGDDQCGLQSELVFAATAGNTYLIRLGTWAFAASGGTGFLDIANGGTTGGCVDPSRGPNVTPGDLDEAIAWGDIGGTSAYSLATTACNIGDTELMWIGGTPDHPVVGHGLYRYRGGRFQQLGTSWVKHGFAAFQRDLCCVCIASSSISSLGVGCSDPYSASLNGFQSGLGPRSEVDANTGIFSWPAGVQTGVPPASTLLDRRLQVATAAMDPALHPQALYFGEAVYAAPDDASAGNGFDNASYRPYVRTGGTTQGAFDLAPGGVTERGLPAITVWPSLSSTARVSEVRIPGEGSYWVGSDAIPVTSTRWRYEICVFNLNSSRRAAAVAAPAGVAPGQPGMSFPRAHSGEPRSNAAWPAQVSAGRMVWVAPQYTVDPNANTIEWGTAYSFWYESDAAPVETAGTLVLSGAGNPSAISFLLVGPREVGAPGTASVCDAEPNSGGTVGRMLPGAFDGPNQRLGLVAVGLPPGSIGYVLASRQQGFTPFAGGSSGNLCLGGAIGRYVGANSRVASVAGSFSVTVDLTAIPQPLGPEAALPGDTWVFQAWHRDTSQSGATSNFTAALEATF